MKCMRGMVKVRERDEVDTYTTEPGPEVQVSSLEHVVDLVCGPCNIMDGDGT